MRETYLQTGLADGIKHYRRTLALPVFEDRVAYSLLCLYIFLFITIPCHFLRWYIRERKRTLLDTSITTTEIFRKIVADKPVLDTPTLVRLFSSCEEITELTLRSLTAIEAFETYLRLPAEVKSEVIFGEAVFVLNRCVNVSLR
jgi:preprotein translocase subunit Sec63